MHEEHDKKAERTDAGLGRVIYNIDDETPKEAKSKETSARREVEIADKESFPASDPPSFSGGTTGDPA